MAKRTAATGKPTEAAMVAQNTDQALVEKVCAAFADAEARRAEEAMRILGDPRTAVHLPFSDTTLPLAAQILGKSR